ncbi:MAG TPA: Uma2 family endonuclease [Bryobacteraceae bacterium]|nr:Uma2 family endonuclease [Bryobacteraceae bacterium]
MALAVAMSVEEYLNTSFEGVDREYVHGEVIERPMGEEKHSDVQWRICGIIFQAASESALYGRPELRLRLTPDIFRIPDVSIFTTRPNERIPSSPPLCVIEIVSPDDRYSALLAKLAEYSAWGVPNIWVVDPQIEKLYCYRQGSLEERPELRLESHGVLLTADRLFR